MTGSAPNRPAGSSRQARWCQWVHDSLLSALNVKHVRGAKVSRKSSGTFVEPLALEGGVGGSRVTQYLLTDASNGDYFICRELSGAAIGATDIYIAKPFHLRQSVFDRDILNEAAPGNIGTEDEVTYDFVVESWNGVTFSSATQSLSYEYKSATFRIATDPDAESTEKQTIIPRFVPAVLIELEDTPASTETIAPTIIYAIQCAGLGVTRPDDPELPEEEQTPIAVSLLALSDGWAWAHTA